VKRAGRFAFFLLLQVRKDSAYSLPGRARNYAFWGNTLWQKIHRLKTTNKT
jgi:hypothetical protein